MVARVATSILAAIVFCLHSVQFIAGKTNLLLCDGPTAYYNALGCKPVFSNTDSICPERYDCDLAKNVPKDKCLVNDHLYDIGESLKDEDANPCDVGCICSRSDSGVAAFKCAVVDCFHGRAKPGCYFQRSPLNCCPGEEICPEKPEDRATCIVNGKVFLDGEYFKVPDAPEKTCVCQPGYVGKNVKPFCAKPNHPYCSPMFRNADKVHENCAPVYYSNQSPQTSCSLFSRCQNDKDIVIESTDDPVETDPDMLCQFGNLTMSLGYELKQTTGYSSACVKCICEVPPTLTCQRLPDNVCDVTKHPLLD